MTRLFLDALSSGKIRDYYSLQDGLYFHSLNQKKMEISATSQNALIISFFLNKITDRSITYLLTLLRWDTSMVLTILDLKLTDLT